jgi:endonuclease/exonuclease/phosphatase (EEP) superfamily protein YafD
MTRINVQSETDCTPSDRDSSAPKPAFTVSGLLEVGSVCLCVAALAGFMGRAWWLLELSSHFRPHIAAALALLSAWWFTRRRRKSGVLCALFSLISVLPVLQVLAAPQRGNTIAQPQIRIASINVHTANRRSDLVLGFIRTNAPDAVLLMEVNRSWMHELASLRDSYPHQVSEAREDNFGIALFSRVPLTNASVVLIGEAEVPSVTAQIILGSSRVRDLGTQPLPPESAEYARLRNEQLAEVARWIGDQHDPVILLGDLNATPWSPHFQELVRRSGLKDSSPLTGFAGSWPATWPLGRIPLDHCLVSPSLRVIARRFGSHVGSDHLPLTVDVALDSVR